MERKSPRISNLFARHALRHDHARGAAAGTVERLGAGWVAGEALAIAVHAALAGREFWHGLQIAVTHGGDSGSTGNLLGLPYPEQALARRRDIECCEMIARIADDLSITRSAGIDLAETLGDQYPAGKETALFTVIPDIHADPQRLEALLAAVGPGPLAFLGDFIDAGKHIARPDDRAVLRRVRALVEDGAPAVMGNHELNAILFHHPDQLRARNDKNSAQHRSFIATFGIATPEAREWTDWFLTLPLWLDLGGLRLVHACWSQPDIDLIAARRPDGVLHREDLPEIAQESTPFGRAVKTLTSGPEVNLPQGHAFADFGGHLRTQMRVAWWRSGAATWREAALSVPDPLALPETALPAGILAEIYPADAPPVLVGHYKMSGEPRVEGRAACLDYPGKLLAYRWQGETQLSDANLIHA